MHPGAPLIRWEHFKKLEEIDAQTAGYAGIRYCRKLTKEHVELNNSSKMRVRLAVQVGYAFNRDQVQLQ